VKYQYFIRNDNLIDRFTAIIQSAKSSLLRYQKDLNYEFEPNKKAVDTIFRRCKSF
jgi:ribosomal protein S17E